MVPPPERAEEMSDCPLTHEIICTDPICLNDGCRVRKTEALHQRALNEAILAVDLYRSGQDSAWAEQWLLKAYEANQSQKETK
jgi:hypothetical protein